MNVQRHALLVVTAVLTTASGVVLVVENGTYRAFEAGVQAVVLRGFGISPVMTLGSDVLLPSHGVLYALAVSPACSAALLTAPFCFITAALVAAGRASPHRGLIALAGVASLLFVVNQVRLIAISLFIRVWGFTTGYERGHILLGTVLSTFGLMIALAVFVLLLVSGRRSKLQHG